MKSELMGKFEKLEAHLVDNKSVLHTPDKAPLTKEDLKEALAEADIVMHHSASRVQRRQHA